MNWMISWLTYELQVAYQPSH